MGPPWAPWGRPWGRPWGPHGPHVASRPAGRLEIQPKCYFSQTETQNLERDLDNGVSECILDPFSRLLQKILYRTNRRRAHHLPPDPNIFNRHNRFWLNWPFAGWGKFLIFPKCYFWQIGGPGPAALKSGSAASKSGPAASKSGPAASKSVPAGAFGAEMGPQGPPWAPWAPYGADLLPKGATWAPLGPLWRGIAPKKGLMGPQGPLWGGIPPKSIHMGPGALMELSLIHI